MSYNIYIGDAKPVVENGYFDWIVDPIEENPDCPDFGDGKSNNRRPGYSQMSNFCEKVGLADLFLDDDGGLLRPHPGIKMLTISHLEIIKNAKEKWEKKHPHAIPGYGAEQDGYIVRLIWYEFWFDWALKNCKYPAISNS